MGDLDYTNYQNLAEQLMGESHAGTLAQYASIVNNPAELGQHLLSDAGAFLIHDKVKDGIKGVAGSLNFSEEDVTGLLGEIGDGASAAIGAIGRLTKNIKGAINDRFGDAGKRLRGHTSPENTAITEDQDLGDTVEEAVARLPGGRTHGLLPFETERPDDEFTNPVNPDAARSAGAPNPAQEELSTEESEAGASAPEPSEVLFPESSPDLPGYDLTSYKSLPPAQKTTDMQNAPNPTSDTSDADAANARNAVEQEGKSVEEDVTKTATRDVEEEVAADVDPVTAVIGVGALIGSFFLHPHEEKQVAPAQMATNYSLQIGA